ncbi:hypothetical protein NQ317_013737 [Molorchus minor]|uniref:Uncharacterized protein n=1 Tax=Molorchus minor TaxID=1323400 RepID=A0ABQ9JCP9_9CUCU|nr:hypothetical protein NQ317_013737 [Molorchus minor]
MNVKQERHDEAEIRELAAKFVEANKAKMAMPQRSSQQAGQSMNILSFLTSDKPKPKTGACTQVTSNDSETKPIDEDSVKGRFGWTLMGKMHIPYIMRSGESYCAVRMVEMKVLNKLLNYLHQDLYNCTNIRSYYITDTEARLLNEINFKHCDYQFGREQFTSRDLIVRLTDANEFYQFLGHCYAKLVNTVDAENLDRCGFIRINRESVVPYTVYSDQKYVPLFYFEGETDNLKQRADKLEGWDLSYLKFCCKAANCPPISAHPPPSPKPATQAKAANNSHMHNVHVYSNYGQPPYHSTQPRTANSAVRATYPSAASRHNMRPYFSNMGQAPPPPLVRATSNTFTEDTDEEDMFFTMVAYAVETDVFPFSTFLLFMALLSSYLVYTEIYENESEIDTKSECDVEEATVSGLGAFILVDDDCNSGSNSNPYIEPSRFEPLKRSFSELEFSDEEYEIEILPHTTTKKIKNETSTVSDNFTTLESKWIDLIFREYSDDSDTDSVTSSSFRSYPAYGKDDHWLAQYNAQTKAAGNYMIIEPNLTQNNYHQASQSNYPPPLLHMNGGISRYEGPQTTRNNLDSNEQFNSPGTSSGVGENGPHQRCSPNYQDANPENAPNGEYYKEMQNNYAVNSTSSQMVNQQPAHQPARTQTSTASDDRNNMTNGRSLINNSGNRSKLSNLPDTPQTSGNNIPYKIQKALVEGKMIPCINMKPNVWTDMLVTLPDLVTNFFNNVPVQSCQQVMQVLGIEVFKANPSQLRLLMENGRCQNASETIPLVQVRNVIDFMPQLKYMLSGMLTTDVASKRQRNS